MPPFAARYGTRLWRRAGGRKSAAEMPLNTDPLLISRPTWDRAPLLLDIRDVSGY
jgi:hypothetical protein